MGYSIAQLAAHSQQDVPESDELAGEPGVNLAQRDQLRAFTIEVELIRMEPDQFAPTKDFGIAELPFVRLLIDELVDQVRLGWLLQGRRRPLLGPGRLLLLRMAVLLELQPAGVNVKAAVRQLLDPAVPFGLKQRYVGYSQRLRRGPEA